MPMQNHTLTSSSRCNFSFITGKLNSLKNFRARENRYGRHAVLNLTGNTFSKIGHKVGNISGTLRLYHYLRMNSDFLFVCFFIIVPVIYPFLLSNCRKNIGTSLVIKDTIIDNNLDSKQERKAYKFHYWAMVSISLFIFYPFSVIFQWVSEWLNLLFNPNSAIFQLYHCENKLIFKEMMMRSVLF